MHGHYKSINISEVSANTQLAQTIHHTVLLEDPAVSIMTDLNKIRAFTIEASHNLEFGMTKMIACGVRLLFVIDTEQSLVGIVTASDLLGEKPILYLQKHGGVRENILIRDLMTPRDQLKTLQLYDVSKARAGDIVETMKTFGRQHILVVNYSEDNHEEYICGLFSTTQISRQLGTSIDILPRANTFAEVGSAISGSF